MFDIERYHQAADVQDAVAVLCADPKAIIIAGGTDVLIEIREGKRAGASLVSLQGLAELKGITREADGTLLIRPLTTFAEITAHPLIQQHLPVLGHAADQVGGPQIRHTGTIGGNLCNGVTSADTASTLFTLNARLEVTGPAPGWPREGDMSDLLLVNKQVPIAEFYLGPGKVALQTGELLTGIRIAMEDYQGYYGHYIKYSMRNAMDIATLGCAVNCRFDEGCRHVEDLRLAFGVAGPVPMRCPETEAALKGMAVGPALFREIGQRAASEVKPRDSWRASKAFRLQLVRELSRRALQQALSYAQAKGGRAHA